MEYYTLKLKNFINLQKFFVIEVLNGTKNISCENNIAFINFK